MLVLIAGVTGSFGPHLIRSALARNHQVRGVGRNPKSLPQDLRNKLESFVEIESYEDAAGLRRACHGVDAVICALRPLAKITLETQLCLLRHAEDAGIKVFVASTWNYDWTRLRFGDLAHYDPDIAFKRHVEMTSSIKPVYFLTGSFAEYTYSPLVFPVLDKGDGSGKNIEYWGEPDQMYDWTSMRDAAEFTFETLGQESVKQGEGGIFTFRSGQMSLRQIAAAYEKVHGVKVGLVCKGSVAELEEIALKAEREGNIQNYWTYLIYFVHLFTLKRIWTLQNPEECPQIKRTTLEEVAAFLPEANIGEK
ncbi:hypothetical protein CLAIMM_03645 [Cladophialophora immunda]|nr:hypothetical protein CLAIMM_03645 [Cladophialophora immunda]